ncbi:hypothetical protein HY970_00195 [Candidatus Kaiserbacteria bacterium]|nr:hypothetical protein [Candidatus Kaiserbacteria bacterium]
MPSPEPVDYMAQFATLGINELRAALPHVLELGTEARSAFLGRAEEVGEAAFVTELTDSLQGLASAGDVGC